MHFHPLYEVSVPSPDAIVDVLVAAGVRYVFGLSGGHTGRIFGALEKRQDEIRTVLVREESLAAAMAETIGRISGSPGVVLGQGPWVLGNGLLGTIEAHLSSTPMLLLTDFSDTPGRSLHAPYQSGTGEYGNWNARQAFAAVTKQVFAAEDPTAAVTATQLAIKHALTGEPGPVAVIFSLRALDGVVGGTNTPRLYPTAPHIAKPMSGLPSLDAVSEALVSAKRPLIIAGNGVRVGQAESSLAAFALKAGIPVVTTPSGKGVFDEEHPLAYGVMGGFGNPSAHKVLGEADVLLAVGTKLSATDTVNASSELIDPSRQHLIQVDVEPRNLAWTFPVPQAILGDAREVLDALRMAWAGDVRENWAGGFNTPRCVPLPASSPGASAIHPHELVMAMKSLLPPETIYACDAGENRIFMLHFLQGAGAGKFIQPAGAGPMGYAIPSAMACKLLRPDVPVVAFSGDGGFSMTMNGLLTAVEARLPIIAIIMNNDALGWSQHSRGAFATQFNRVNYATIAMGMGCAGFRASGLEALKHALAEALAVTRGSDQPAVIDVETSMEVSFAKLSYQETRRLSAA